MARITSSDTTYLEYPQGKAGVIYSRRHGYLTASEARERFNVAPKEDYALLFNAARTTLSRGIPHKNAPTAARKSQVQGGFGMRTIRGAIGASLHKSRRVVADTTEVMIDGLSFGDVTGSVEPCDLAQEAAARMMAGFGGLTGNVGETYRATYAAAYSLSRSDMGMTGSDATLRKTRRVSIDDIEIEGDADLGATETLIAVKESLRFLPASEQAVILKVARNESAKAPVTLSVAERKALSRARVALSRLVFGDGLTTAESKLLATMPA